MMFSSTSRRNLIPFLCVVFWFAEIIWLVWCCARGCEVLGGKAGTLGQPKTVAYLEMLKAVGVAQAFISYPALFIEVLTGL